MGVISDPLFGPLKCFDNIVDIFSVFEGAVLAFPPDKRAFVGFSKLPIFAKDCELVAKGCSSTPPD